MQPTLLFLRPICYSGHAPAQHPQNAKPEGEEFVWRVHLEVTGTTPIVTASLSTPGQNRLDIFFRLWVHVFLVVSQAHMHFFHRQGCGAEFII